MKADEIRKLPIGTRIKGKLGTGVVSMSYRYGKGVRLDNWSYISSDDIHGFNDRTDKNLEELVEEVI